MAGDRVSQWSFGKTGGRWSQEGCRGESVCVRLLRAGGRGFGSHRNFASAIFVTPDIIDGPANFGRTHIVTLICALRQSSSFRAYAHLVFFRSCAWFDEAKTSYSAGTT
jgi:hypothetical protein